jgi:methylated-DNA-[protein]-cysteine S-methyltransferase
MTRSPVQSRTTAPCAKLVQWQNTAFVKRERESDSHIWLCIVLIYMKTFTEKVYEITKKVPKGKTLTYKEVAIKIGHPKSARAVGTVLSKNFNIEIPCHRVIRSDGKMGGYNRGGVEKKEQILKKEKGII